MYTVNSLFAKLWAISGGRKLNILLNPSLNASCSKICTNIWCTDKKKGVKSINISIQALHQGHHQE